MSAERCAGGYVDYDKPAFPSSPGWWKADCPSCGRRIAFHWATGRFRTHNRVADTVASRATKEG